MALEADGASIRLAASNTSDAQIWYISRAADGAAYTLLNVQTGLVIDVPGAQAASGATLQQYTSNGTAAQRGNILTNTDGSYTIFSALSNNLAIDLPAGSTASGITIQLYANNNTAAKKWTLIPTQTTRQQLDSLVAKNADVVQDDTYYP